MNFCYIAKSIFFAILIIATIVLISYNIYDYGKNEDTSVISFQRYNDNEKNIYPAITLCFTDYLNPNLFNNTSHENEYKDFLSGKTWNDEMNLIDYKRVAKDIDDYLLQISLRTYNLEENEYSILEYKTRDTKATTWRPKYYRSHYDLFAPHAMCWTFAIDSIHQQSVDFLSFYFKASMFKDSIRKPYGNFVLLFGYPGQISAATAMKYTWKPANYTSFTMEFNIQNVVVLKQRKKFVKSCNSHWKKHDDTILQIAIEKIGCKPIFFAMESSMPACRNSSNFIATLNKLKNNIQPCKKMEKVLYSYNEYHSEFNGKNFGVEESLDIFAIDVLFQGTTFTQIEQTRAYDFQSLVGNAGGYVGLFLGAAISQLPSAISMLLAYFKSKSISIEKNNS